MAINSINLPVGTTEGDLALGRIYRLGKLLQRECMLDEISIHAADGALLTSL